MRLLGHRGPDARGVHVGPGVGLAHTRLSLIDPDPRSHQPFWDPSGRYALIYNGEIYNFRELRTDLERRGVVFHTTSDTEVLLHCLIHDPPANVLSRLDGMFAFGFYDTREDTLLIARDRFGMKPLYYSEGHDGFVFASEVKALRPWLPFEADAFSISAYLMGFNGPSKGFTFYKGIKALPPGTFITLRRGEAPRPASFFALPDFWNREDMTALGRLSARQAADRLEELLFEAVTRQMFADARIGAFCSGGVDSSLLVAMASRMHDNLAIFHANILGRWSEYEAARQLSAHLKLDLHVVEVADQDFVDKLADAMRQYEHPYTYHPNSVPFMMVARLARANGVKGMLSGEGSDELFLGYPWFWRQPWVSRYNAMARKLRSRVRAIPSLGPIIWPYEGDTLVVQRLLNRGEVAGDELTVRLAAAMLAPVRIDSRQLMSMDYLHYHLRTLLHRNDCLGMEASIEARFPFLDHSVVRTAINMPSRYKLRFSPTVFEKAHPFIRDKWVLREVARRWIPRALSQRVKIGFWTTVFERMDVAAAYFHDSLVRELLELSREEMRTVVSRADQDLKLRLLHLDVWTHVCLYGCPVDESSRKIANHVSIRPE